MRKIKNGMLLGIGLALGMSMVGIVQSLVAMAIYALGNH